MVNISIIKLFRFAMIYYKEKGKRGYLLKIHSNPDVMNYIISFYLLFHSIKKIIDTF